ncbi:unnamed protein product [Brachionus calyciflorus]|uniref:Uncharacterized protein n=1 Tax=Brachionus calyciflorus TaxID=104777 RepID=A0A814F6N8_9BILA|nr:unnamed protein product [Brachionus calyciflorus]
MENKTIVSFLTICNGYVFMELDKKTFKLKQIAVDKTFVRKYATLELGFFYGAENPLGLFSLDKIAGPVFHYVNLKTPKTPFIKHDKTNQYLDKQELNWHLGDAKFFTADPFKLFEINLDIETNTKFFFTRLTPASLNSFLDILVIQSDGLYVYKWDNKEAKYSLINFSNEFSKTNNWTFKHTQSILFSDFDSTGFDKFVYSGPNGLRIDKLEFSQDKNEWVWIRLLDLHSCSGKDLGLKYLVPIEIIPLNKSACKKPVLIANDVLNKKNILIPIEEQQLEDNLDDNISEKEEFTKPEERVQNFPQFIHEKTNAKEKTVLYLRNVLDLKSIVNSCVNPTNAQLQLKLPLIGLPVFDDPLVLNYTSAAVSTSSNSPFGQGFSFSQDFIYAELKSNRALHRFYLIDSSGSVVLNREENETKEDEICFNIENREEKVKFYVNESKWIVESDSGKKVYGGGLSVSKPKGNGIEWKNIFLKSSSTTVIDDLASFKWHLTSVHREYDTAMFEYTEGPFVCLKEIRVNDNDINVKFELDENKNLVQGFKFESKHHVKNIKFDYEIQNDSTHLLKSITQMDNKSKVLQFDYLTINNSFKMNKIVLPDNIDCVSFDYEDASQKFINSYYNYLSDAEMTVYEDKDTTAQLNVSSNYSVLSYVTESKTLLCLTIFTCDKLKFNIKLNAAKALKKDCMDEYKIVLFADHLVIWLFDSEKKEDQIVCLCHLYSARNLVQTPLDQIDVTHTLKMIQNVQNVFIGSDFVTVSTRSKEIVVYEWVECEWLASFREKFDSTMIKMCANQDQTVLVYDDTCLRFLFKDKNGDNAHKWNMKKVSDKVKCGLLTEVHTFANSFNLSEDKIDEIKLILERNSLHFSKNLILFNRINIDQDTVYSNLLILSVDDEYNVIKEETLVNKSIVLNEHIKELEIKFSDIEVVHSQLYHFKDDTSKYSVGFKYQKKDFNFKVKKKTYKRTFELDKQIIKTFIFDNHGYEVEQEDNEKCVADEFKDAFVLNLELLHVTLTNNRVVSQDKYFDLDSNRTWKITQSENKNQSLKIGDIFELAKKESTWKLYSKNEQIFDFETEDINRIQVAFPSYIAYMKDSDKSVLVLPFENNNTIGNVYILSQADYVLLGGSPLGFGIKETGSCKVKFFTISPNSFTRIKSRSTIQNGMIFYSKFKSIPAGDESKFGHIEYDFDKGVSYFNSDGKLVKIEMEKDQSQNESGSSETDLQTKKHTVLFAKVGRTEVANFFNLDVQSDQADYFGFEDYEHDKNWVYDKAWRVDNKWSFTGSTFLNIVKGNKIEKIFRLEEKAIYECSCWVRVSKSYSVNDKFEDFKLTITEKNTSIVSKVASVHQEWLYLTVQIDLSELNGRVSVQCKIEARLHDHIHVDHIKWMQMYGHETNTIKRLVYNESKEPLVLIDSNNQLLQSSFSYNWNKTHVELEANSSVFIANFSDYSLRKNWVFENPADWTRSGNFISRTDNQNKSSIRLKDESLRKSSIALYFRAQLDSSSELSLEFNSHKIQFKSDNILVNSQKIGDCGNGFFLLVAISNRLIVWKEKHVLVDQKFDLAQNSAGVAFTTSGLAKLSEVLVVNEPIFKVNHLNSFNLICQSVQLESDSSVIIKEKICDELMRDSIETKPTRLFIQKNEPSLAYRHDFVTNKSFDSQTSVWQTKKLQGKINELNGSDEGFSHQRKIYSKDPLNYIESVEFAEQLLSHKTAPKSSLNNSFEYFASLFPIQDGFVCQTSYELNGNRNIKVYDKDNNMVALFQHTNDFKDKLTTYEFDKNQNLVKILAPLQC